MNKLRRREFIGLVGSAATVWSLGARAQQANSPRKVGVLMNFSAEDPEGKARIQAFSQSLRNTSWIEGGNLRTEVRWAGDDRERYHQYARELVSSAPDVILASASQAVAALQEVTQSVPIVFANVIDPVGAGFIASLARPGGNTTGFTAFEYSVSGKWLELLNELAPGSKRVAVVREPYAAGIGQFAAIQTLASSSIGLELTAIDPQNPTRIERALAAFAFEPNGGLIVTASSSAVAHRELLIALALRHRLPAVYPFRYYVANGGLAAYGPDSISIFVRAADYVHRILNGTKPSDLPVQAPTKYELTLNLKTAKALGLSVAPGLLARADEVIE